MERMEKFIVALVAVFIVSASLLVGLTASFFAALDGEPQNFSHRIEYSAEIRANGTLNDTEFLLPYPDDEKFREALVNDSLENVTVINDFNASTSLTDSGLLRLDIGDFRPETREERFPREDVNITPEEGEKIKEADFSGINEYSSYSFIVQIDYNRSIDTRRGLSNEPYLSSNSTECRSPRESGCATTEAFLSYEADNSTYLEMSVGIDGWNEWTEGFSWSGNSYRQDFYNSFYSNDYLRGSQENWIELFGREVEGDGVYREK